MAAFDLPINDTYLSASHRNLLEMPSPTRTSQTGPQSPPQSFDPDGLVDFLGTVPPVVIKLLVELSPALSVFRLPRDKFPCSVSRQSVVILYFSVMKSTQILHAHHSPSTPLGICLASEVYQVDGTSQPGDGYAPLSVTGGCQHYILASP